MRLQQQLSMVKKRKKKKRKKKTRLSRRNQSTGTPFNLVTTPKRLIEVGGENQENKMRGLIYVEKMFSLIKNKNRRLGQIEQPSFIISCPVSLLAGSASGRQWREGIGTMKRTVSVREIRPENLFKSVPVGICQIMITISTMEGDRSERLRHSERKQKEKKYIELWELEKILILLN